MPPQPAVRHRAKSPQTRGRSPDPKKLRQAAQSADSGSETASRAVTFGKNTVHPIKAENPPGHLGKTKPMGAAEAEDVLRSLLKDLGERIPSLC